MTAPTAAPRAKVIEKPMLFSAPMVRAILEGRKTQTRRVVKRQPPKTHQCLLMCDEVAEIAFSDKPEPPASVWPSLDCGIKIPHPVGSRIWIKETWRSAKSLDNLSPRQMAKAALDAGYRKPWAPTQYEADGARNNWEPYFDGDRIEPGKKRVSIHMPRWASRITLEVTDVRVERLQDISRTDAIAEGVEEPRTKLTAHQIAQRRIANIGNDELDDFCHLWESINGPDSWAANPWVWVYTFKHLSTEATG